MLADDRIKEVIAAVEKYNYEVLSELLSKGYPVNPEWKKDELLLHDARIGFYEKFASESDYPLLVAIKGWHKGQNIVLLGGAELQSKRRQTEQRIHDDIRKNPTRKRDIVKLLLQCGARTNRISPSFVDTFLTFAIKEGNPDAVEAMLDFGCCSPNEMNQEGELPLILAIKLRLWKIVDLLIRYRADPNVVSANGKSALDLLVDYISGTLTFQTLEDSMSQDSLGRILINMIENGADICWENQQFLILLPNLATLAAQSKRADVLDRISNSIMR